MAKTAHEWQVSFEQALEPAGSESDRDGKSRYFVVFEAMRRAKAHFEWSDLIGGIEHLCIAHRDKPADWWLRMANLLYSLAPMVNAEKRELSSCFHEHWPHNPEARSYVLRALADLGCPIDWVRVLNWGDARELAPMLLVDAMIRGRRISEALSLVSEARFAGRISNSDLAIVLPRWQKKLPPLEARQLARGLEPQETEGQAALMGFVDKLRRTSVVFISMDPHHPKIPAHIAAKHTQEQMGG
jgi:hypothetical protein